MSDPMLVEVLRAVNNLTEKVEGHIADETSDIKKMREQAEARSKLADERHAEILQALSAVNIVEALPKMRDGKPDVVGHRNDHETRMAATAERIDFIKDLIKGGIKAGLWLFLLWAGVALWQAFLLGPKP